MSRGPWTQTYTGRAFYPFDPRPEDVCIDDIAHALALQCRFNGHVREFYSVAQHSVFVSRIVPTEHALVGLMHDAAEAYVGDLVRPIKKMLPAFEDIEDHVYRVIAKRFGVAPVLPQCVKEADGIALATEKRDVMAAPPQAWVYTGEPHPHIIEPWTPAEAERAFLERFYELTGGRA